MVRKAMRKPAVLEATGWPPSTLYWKIKHRLFPKGTRLDPNGKVVVWWEDEVAQVQNGTWKAPEQTEAAA
jgi:predicted DNA-binding transcriptional regulator AlpA